MKFDKKWAMRELEIMKGSLINENGMDICDRVWRIYDNLSIKFADDAYDIKDVLKNLSNSIYGITGSIDLSAEDILTNSEMIGKLLNKLLVKVPLTMLPDSDWIEIGSPYNKSTRIYHHNRYLPLLKRVRGDEVSYSDQNRVVSIDINTYDSYYDPLVRSIIDEMFPIKMPYIVGNPSICHVERFDFCGMKYIGILAYIAKKENDKNIEKIFRFFKYKNDYQEISEIDRHEYFMSKIQSV